MKLIFIPQDDRTKKWASTNLNRPNEDIKSVEAGIVEGGWRTVFGDALELPDLLWLEVLTTNGEQNTLILDADFNIARAIQEQQKIDGWIVKRHLLEIENKLREKSK